MFSLSNIFIVSSHRLNHIQVWKKYKLQSTIFQMDHPVVTLFNIIAYFTVC